MPRENRPIRAPRSLRLTALLFALAFSLGACGDPAVPLSAEVEDLRLVREPNGTQVLSGVVHNSSDRPIRGAQIVVDLYDGSEEGAAESMRVEVQYVEPGERKAFRQEVDTGLALTGVRHRTTMLY